MASQMPSDRASQRPSHRSPSPVIRLSWEEKAVLVLAVLIVLALALLAMTIWW